MILSTDIGTLTTEEKLLRSLDVALTVEEMFINGRHIRYVTAGAGDPVLLIHGANFGWGMWYANIPELAKHFKVYAIDLPGAGRSSPVDLRHFDLQKELVLTVEQFIHRLDLPELNIIGHSVGGWVAAKVALQNPQKIKRLALLDPAGFSDKANVAEKLLSWYPFAQMLARTVLQPKRENKNLEKFLRGAFFDQTLSVPAPFIDYFYETITLSHGILFMSRLIQLRTGLLLKDDMSRCRTKTFILWGENDPILPFKRNAVNIPHSPQVRVVVIPAAGHTPFIEKSAQVNRLILDFFKNKDLTPWKS
jgi:pimeloyl-ACP methyl ester carboxylesterase